MDKDSTLNDIGDIEVNDINSGDEPGASSEPYLVAVDIGDGDVNYNGAESSDDNLEKTNRTRSGTISRIKRDIKRQQRQQNYNILPDSIQSDDTGTSSISANVSESESDNPSADNDINIDALSRPYQDLSIARFQEEDHDPDLEYVRSSEWKNKKKHIFILSQSGKPIYSLHGNEEKLVTTFGVMQALVSFIAYSEEKDTLRSIEADDRRIVFLVKEHLILVAVSSLDESIRHLRTQLHYVYHQIISILTLKTVNKVFTQKTNYDLRRMLGGTDKFIENLVTMMGKDPSYLLASVRCLPLNSSVRETITQTIVQCCKIKDLVFALIISDNQLVTLVRMKKFSLHPQDLHLILNLIQSSDYFKAAEAWLPICLPNFDSSGFLHAYISYLDEPCNACLVLLTVDSEQFSALSDCKAKIVERLNRSSCLQSIAESVASHEYTTQQVGIPELRHFIYKSRSTAQYTSPKVTVPYVTQEQQERLYLLYQSVHSRMHSKERPIRIFYEAVEYESILGWITNGFELYAVYSPLISKQAAISSITKLMKWIKKEESRLFIYSQTTF